MSPLNFSNPELELVSNASLPSKSITISNNTDSEAETAPPELSLRKTEDLHFILSQVEKSAKGEGHKAADLKNNHGGIVKAPKFDDVLAITIPYGSEVDDQS